MPTETRFFSRGSWSETARFAEILRKETVGGVLLLIAAAAALIWANSPWSDTYHGLTEFVIGPHELHLDLSLGAWASDGLLAIFFFVVGLELKREFVAGDLRDPARALLPIVAALGGMVVPAALYLVVNTVGDGGEPGGWAVPIATDIAFALAVLAVLGTHLPAALRTFLLTLAVVDDLLAITVIAVFYTDHLAMGPLLLALIPAALFGLAVQRGIHHWWLLLPLAAATWALVHASGIHATVAGVILGFLVPVIGRQGNVAERFEHALRPLSAGFAVPVFAFFAAGVTVGGLSGLGESFGHPVTLGVLLGLVVGKPLGVWVTTFLLAKLSRARLDDELEWLDVFGIALLSGIGFTVSLLIGELAFGYGSESGDDAKLAVLGGSVCAGLLAATVLVARNARYRRICEAESRDDDRDGIPDLYQARPE